jgi:polyisoprenoid-binding protein YceI
MKSKLKLLLITVMVLSLSACKNAKNDAEKTAETGFTVVDSTATIKWTAYKTTEKLPVSGVFKTINITNSKQAQTAELALDSLQFSIPVSSLFSNNPERDGKLKDLFFGIMANTSLLNGTIHVEGDKMGSLEVVMNGVTKSLPLTFTTAGDTIHFSGVMNLPEWNVTEAFASLNKACFDLHKGKDGISKTWDDVLIEASVVSVKK